MANCGATNIFRGLIFVEHRLFKKKSFYECQAYGRNAFFALLPCYLCLTQTLREVSISIYMTAFDLPMPKGTLFRCFMAPKGQSLRF